MEKMPQPLSRRAMEKKGPERIKQIDTFSAIEGIGRGGLHKGNLVLLFAIFLVSQFN